MKAKHRIEMALRMCCLSLVPKPRVNLTRYHGVFASSSKHRARITPAKRGKGSTAKEDANAHARTPAEQHVAMTWAQRLKRILDHLDQRETKYQQTSQHRQPSSRAPPMQG